MVFVAKVLATSILLLLLLRPLFLHRQNCNRLATKLEQEIRGRKTKRKLNTAKRLLKAIKLATWCAVVSSTSDFVATTIDYYVIPASSAPSCFINSMWNSNLLINVASILTCFNGFLPFALWRLGLKKKEEKAVVSKREMPGCENNVVKEQGFLTVPLRRRDFDSGSITSRSYNDSSDW